jgi:hypothetical protein
MRVKNYLSSLSFVCLLLVVACFFLFCLLCVVGRPSNQFFLWCSRDRHIHHGVVVSLAANSLLRTQSTTLITVRTVQYDGQTASHSSQFPPHGKCRLSTVHSYHSNYSFIPHRNPYNTSHLIFIMNSVPITDILPWGDHSPPTGGRTILIYDSAESNGRFLLYTIAAQTLKLQQTSSSSSSSSDNTRDDKRPHVLWIHCGTKTDSQIYAGMKKNGIDVKGTKLGESKIHILRSISTDNSMLVPQILSQNNQPETNTSSWDDEKKSLKLLYQRIKNITSQWSKYVIILDDASFMSTYFGGNLTFAFIQKVRNMVRKESLIKQNSLILLASNDLDQECFAQSTNQQEKNVTGGKNMQYIGAGGKGMLNDPESLTSMELGSLYELGEMVWERALVELADGIVDVLPLASGFAKDVHGRLVFTCRRGGGLGWRDAGVGSSMSGSGSGSSSSSFSAGDSKRGSIGRTMIGGFAPASSTPHHFSTTLVNYCCTDSGVKAIRLRV